MTAATNVQGATTPAAHNEVILVGRLSAAPTARTLPSGDELISWRLVVERAGGRTQASGVRLPTVDTIDCITYRAGVRRLASRWSGGEILQVSGALRRRFWRGAQGPASRCEVEVMAAKKLAQASGDVTRRTGKPA
jgi:single-strand DNA-binding protein